MLDVRRTVVFALAAVACLVLASVAYAGNGGVAPPAPRSPNAGRIDDTYYLLLGITGAIFVLVETALVVFVVRFRRRGHSREVEGPQIIGHSRLELIWTVVPVVILAAIAGFVFYKLPGIKDVPSARAGTRMAVRVEGHQFYWRYVYADGTVAVDRLRVPVGEVVTLSIVSQDVAHSWWIPQLGGKTDAIPGRTNHTWFRIRRTGVYHGQCAEFCGIQHAVMTATVEAMPASAFRSWLARQHATPSDLGKETFEGVCAKCHGFRGQGYIGPKLAGSSVARDRKALAKTIREGVRTMPPVGANWDERQVNAVIDYIRRNIATGGGAGGG
jgi:cytochrome c oxidase subunit 2